MNDHQVCAAIRKGREVEDARALALAWERGLIDLDPPRLTVKGTALLDGIEPTACSGWHMNGLPPQGDWRGRLKRRHRMSGIIFTGAMVRALLREIATPGTGKTQTRRVIADGRTGERPKGDHARHKVGDILWVRESWTYINHQDRSAGLEVCIGYNADGPDLPNRPSIIVPEEWCEKVDRWPFRNRRWPSIHMPRWASRISLKVTSVRVERLQHISLLDALEEGIEMEPPYPEDDFRPLKYGIRDGDELHYAADHPAYSFKALWDSIHGTDGHAWSTNPWVAVYTFRPFLTPPAQG